MAGTGVGYWVPVGNVAVAGRDHLGPRSRLLRSTTSGETRLTQIRAARALVLPDVSPPVMAIWSLWAI
jgi:hypothetical protein